MRLEERFLSKVCKTPGCWNWQGSTIPDGYGQLQVCGRGVLAHRLSYELFIGPIINSLHVLHSCDNRLCVRPSHLRLGTNRENIQDAFDRGRRQKGQGLVPTTFHNGVHHVLTPEDVRAIRESYKNGDSYRELAQRYGVTIVTISHVVRRVTWRSVE